MFYLIRKMLTKALSLDALTKRVAALETQAEKFKGLAKENEALWHLLDGDDPDVAFFGGSAEDFEKELTEILLQHTEPYGDA